MIANPAPDYFDRSPRARCDWLVADGRWRSGADLGRTVVIADKESNFTKSPDTIGFAPQSEVFVVTNVFVNGLSATDAINLTSFTQAFSEIELAVLPGDYNHNGIVDAGDYVVWRDTLGQTGIGLAADGNANGQIDTADYDVWCAHFSHTAASGTLTGRAVSEPTTSFLLTLAIAGWCSGRRQKARHKNR